MFNLNSQEKKVLVFIAALVLIGIGVSYFQKQTKRSIQISSFNLGPENQSTKININTATNEDLVKIPGIGPELALRIIEFRELRGPFSNIEELKSVRGIGDKKFQDLKGVVTLGE